MNFDELSTEMPSIKRLLDWFGRWPSFHDSEVVSIELNRVNLSRVVVHAFVMTDKTDSTGHYVNERHARIHFLLDGVSNAELYGFNHQNVLSSLDIAKREKGYELLLHQCYGVAGSILADDLSVEVEPGMPSESVYARDTQNGVGAR